MKCCNVWMHACVKCSRIDSHESSLAGLWTGVTQRDLNSFCIEQVFRFIAFQKPFIHHFLRLCQRQTFPSKIWKLFCELWESYFILFSKYFGTLQIIDKRFELPRHGAFVIRLRFYFGRGEGTTTHRLLRTSNWHLCLCYVTKLTSSLKRTFSLKLKCIKQSEY